MRTIEDQFESFRTITAYAKKIVLTTHINPDGDGLGSELALADYLAAKGKEPVILNHSPMPEFYRFLDPESQINQFDPSKHASRIRDADLIIVVDTNHPDRIAGLREHVLGSKASKVIIDHHLDPHPFASLQIIDDLSAATGQIVYCLLEYLGALPLSPLTASALYVAIMTDTGSFRYPKTDGNLHRIVASLIDQGADPVSSYQNIFEQSSPGRIHLLGMVLAGIELHHKGLVSVMTVAKNLFDKTGTSEVDVDRFVPYALTIRNVRIALMFTELENEVKVSFRSRGAIQINDLAREFGGNGHKNAAGARIPNGALADIKEKVIERSQHYLSEMDSQ